MRRLLTILLTVAVAGLLLAPVANASVGLDTPLQIAMRHLTNLVREEASLGVGCVIDASVVGTWGQSVHGDFRCTPTYDTIIPAKHMNNLAVEEATIGMQCFVAVALPLDGSPVVVGLFLCFPAVKGRG